MNVEDRDGIPTAGACVEGSMAGTEMTNPETTELIEGLVENSKGLVSMIDRLCLNR